MAVNATLHELNDWSQAFEYPDSSNLKNRRAAIHKLTGGATEVGRKLMKILTADVKEVPNMYTREQVRTFEKSGDIGTLKKDFSKFGYDQKGFLDGMDIIRKGDRILMASHRGRSGKPTLTIFKHSDLEPFLRKEQTILPRAEIIYNRVD